ncbi:hypothetical protein J113_18950 [Mycobacterium tuberculosis CAS/NITR204]|uniref:Uncharacterized protein n=1 Tax=Mycobacterium tuberculosis CAS/NITR204 TaxID=1310114 RepID=R4MBD6_MYCTX|nr:hypothetical protein J113_18950 [Mycobacterium tuberculosis CAS/NITR204]
MSAAAARWYARHGRGFGDIQDIELMMRDATALADGQLRRPDVHAAIQLHRVGVHDLHAHPGASRAATSSANWDLPAPVGPIIANGLTAARHRRNTPRRVALLGRTPWPIAVLARQAGQHLKCHPPKHLCGQPGQDGEVAAGQRVVESPLHTGAVGVIAAGSAGRQGVQAVGDD